MNKFTEIAEVTRNKPVSEFNRRDKFTPTMRLYTGLEAGKQTSSPQEDGEYIGDPKLYDESYFKNVIP